MDRGAGGRDIHVDWTRLPASPNVAHRLGIE